jgi:hypothetical protein
MNPFGKSLLDPPIRWFRYQPGMPPEHVRGAIESLGFPVIEVRESDAIVFVEAESNHENDSAIRSTLERWSFWQGPPHVDAKQITS